MKKLLVLALSVVMVLSFAALTMAEATLSGEIQTGYKSTSMSTDYFPGAKGTSTDYALGKMILNGKLGEDCTGKLVYLADPANGAIKVDEADILFTEGFGTAKFGYFGWNNNVKDIVDSYRDDVKTQFVSSVAIKASENVTVGIAYGYHATDAAGNSDKANSSLYGVDLGYATDTFGVNLIFTNTGKNSLKITAPDGTVVVNVPAADVYGTTGINAWYKMDALKFFLQYVTEDSKAGKDLVGKDVAPTNTIIGLTYEPADAPFYGRFEYDLSSQKDLWGDKCGNEMGIRLGYKLADGAKIEFQNNTDNIKTSNTSIKLIAAF